MKDNAIILDLDDTLLSTHYRQYCCINDYLTNTGLAFIDFDRYFQLRRTKKISNTQLLTNLNIDPDWEKFRTYYRENIEAEKYLALDELIVEKHFLTDAVQKNFKLIVLSLRSNHENSKKQLAALDIANFFTAVYFEQHDFATNPKLKRLQQLNTDYNLISFCGDALSDYEAAQQLNINFVQVKTSLYQLPNFEQATQFNNINEYFLSIL